MRTELTINIELNDRKALKSFLKDRINKARCDGFIEALEWVLSDKKGEK